MILRLLLAVNRRYNYCVAYRESEVVPNGSHTSPITTEALEKQGGKIIFISPKFLFLLVQSSD